MTPDELVGKKYRFEDGAEIIVIQIKPTDEDRGGHLVTYTICSSPLNLPRKLVMPIGEFVNTYGHLFK